MDEQFKAEIIETHDFLTGWLSGSLPKNDETFAPFAAVLADDFMIISPSGVATRREALLPGLQQAHGAEGVDFRIWIENCDLRWREDTACVGTYEEWQESDGAQSARLSSIYSGTTMVCVTASSGSTSMRPGSPTTDRMCRPR